MIQRATQVLLSIRILNYQNYRFHSPFYKISGREGVSSLPYFNFFLFQNKAYLNADTRFLGRTVYRSGDR